MSASAVKSRVDSLPRRFMLLATAVTVLLTVGTVASSADATPPRRSALRSGPSLTVRAERHDGAVNGIPFSEDVDAIALSGIPNTNAARIDTALARSLASSRAQFEAGLRQWRGPANTPPFHLTIRVIGSEATRELTSVVYQNTVDSTALAHPFSRFDALNFDREGASLSLLQLLRPGGVEGMAQALTPVLAQTLGTRGDAGCSSDPRSVVALLGAGSDQPGAHVGFTPAGALVAFDDYSLGYYACGDATISVPYNTLIGVVPPQFLPASLHGQAQRVRLVVTPRRNLTDDQRVATLVTGLHLPDGDYALVRECAADFRVAPGGADARCQYFATTTLVAARRAPGIFDVTRSITTRGSPSSPITTIDCGATPSACVLVAIGYLDTKPNLWQTHWFGAPASVPLTFARHSAPVGAARASSLASGHGSRAATTRPIGVT